MFLRLLQNIINSLHSPIFFVAYKIGGISLASAALVVFHVFLLGFNGLILKKVFYTNVITTIIVCGFSTATVLTTNPLYVQFHITVLNCFFAMMLFAGVFLKKNFLRFIIGDLLPAGGNIWIDLSKYWALLFLFIAVLNEILVLMVSEVVWVYFVSFGISFITFFFVLFQINYIKRNIVES